MLIFLTLSIASTYNIYILVLEMKFPLHWNQALNSSLCSLASWCCTDTVLFLIFLCFALSLLNDNSGIQMPNCKNLLPGATYGSLASLSMHLPKALLVSSGCGILLAAKKLFVHAFLHRRHFSWHTFSSKEILHTFLSIRESIINTVLRYNRATIQISSLYGQGMDLTLVPNGLNTIRNYLVTLKSRISSVIKSEDDLHCVSWL